MMQQAGSSEAYALHISTCACINFAELKASQACVHAGGRACTILGSRAGTGMRAHAAITLVWFVQGAITYMCGVQGAGRACHVG